MDASIAPMVVMVTLILTSGGVILFRPVTRRLADYLQFLVEQKDEPRARQELQQATEALSSLEARLGLLEERQRFTDSLLSARSEPRPLEVSSSRNSAVQPAASLSDPRIG